MKCQRLLAEKKQQKTPQQINFVICRICPESGNGYGPLTFKLDLFMRPEFIISLILSTHIAIK